MGHYLSRRRRWQMKLYIACALAVCAFTSRISVAEPVTAQTSPDESKSFEELEASRFGDLTDESVQRECDEWVKKNNWSFGRSLSEIRDTGSKVTPKDMLALLEKLRLQEASQYEKHTQDTGTLRKQGADVMDMWARYPMDDSDPEYLGRVGQQAVEVVKAGSKDPLIRTIATCFWQSQDYKATVVTLNQLDGELKAAGYGSNFQFLIQRNLMLIAVRHQLPNRSEIVSGVTKSICEYIKDESGNRESTQVLWQYLSAYDELLSEAEHLDLYRALLQSDKTDPFLLHMFVALYSYNSAWRARGGGFASSVSDEAWTKFHELLSKASLHHRKAWLLRPDIPNAPAIMITIANANSENETWTERQWFELACHARFDFGLNYNSYMNPLKPRWGGSHAAMLEFGRECAETEAFETPVPYYLIEFISLIAEEVPDHSVWQDDRILSILIDFWNSMHAWGDKNKVAKDGALWRKQVSLEAAVFVRNGMFKEARQVIDDLPGPPDFMSMQKVYRDPILAASMAYALSDPAAQPLLEIESRLGENFASDATVADISKALETVRAALAANKTPHAERYLKVRAYSLQKQEAFEAGDWVELEFDNPAAAWGVSNGTAVVESSQVVRISNLSSASLPVRLFPNVQFRPPFSIAARIERIKGTESFEYFGINVEPISQATMLGAPGGMAFVVGSTPPVAGTWLPGRQGAERFPVENLVDSAELTIDVWPTAYQMTVDGKTIPVVGYERFRPNGGFSIGSNPYAAGRGELRVTKVKVRKLTEPAPE